MTVRPRCGLRRGLEVPASEVHSGWLFDQLALPDRINDQCKRSCRVCACQNDNGYIFSLLSGPW